MIYLKSFITIGETVEELAPQTDKQSAKSSSLKVKLKLRSVSKNKIFFVSLRQVKLLKMLRVTSQSRVRKGLPCVESCVRTLVTSLDVESPVSRMFSSCQDECIPFPRTSGAKFSAVGEIFFTGIFRKIPSRYGADDHACAERQNG